MPRRRQPDPLALAVGQRIRQLREEAGLTLEALAFESARANEGTRAYKHELSFSKGHLSNLERGLVAPNVLTLQALATALHVHLLDLLTFPEVDERQRLVDATRALPEGTIRKLLKDCETTKPRARKRPVPASG
ncbi:MAG TPA: helix-turn-helix transcriptional regulator [Polyangiaceae bacterium]|nr:helix-turn-helix transcriptional regulator [Polyangiaceae bacterium]